jgi:hypothetical protein
MGNHMRFFHLSMENNMKYDTQINERIETLQTARVKLTDKLKVHESTLDMLLATSNESKSRVIGYDTFIEHAMSDPNAGIGASARIADYHNETTQRIYEDVRVIDKKIKLLRNAR